MGRGDVKTAKGKRFRSSFGKSRPRKAGTNFTIPLSEVKENKLATTTTAKKTPAKKTEDKAPAKKKAASKPAAKKTETKTTAKKADSKEESKEK